MKYNMGDLIFTEKGVEIIDYIQLFAAKETQYNFVPESKVDLLPPNGPELIKALYQRGVRFFVKQGKNIEISKENKIKLNMFGYDKIINPFFIGGDQIILDLKDMKHGEYCALTAEGLLVKEK